jgi:signal transduction histidine kinase
VLESFGTEPFANVLAMLESMASSMRLVTTIEESIGRVTALVQAVKSYAYEGKGQRQKIDLNDSLHGTLILLGHKFREKQIEVTREFTAGLPKLETTNTGLSQVWTNLIDNAVDAVPQGGHVTVRTWLDTDGAGTALLASITDNGPGIVQQDQACIYDPFYTTKPVGVGTGLGLGIVRRVVEEIGGSVTLDSHPGQTTFTVRLPVNGY